jgi:CRP-like cAMP-binding protein
VDRAIQAPHHSFLRKIESIALFDLSVAEREALEALPIQASEFAAHQDVVVENERPDRSFIVLDGIAAAYKMTETGQRQVVAFYVPGDVPDFQSLHLEVLDFSICAATPLRVGFVGHDAIRNMFERHPRLTDTFWRVTLIEGSLSREWMLNNCRREAYSRLAHLFCEILVRMERVGLASNHSCKLALTQYELADALGVTQVHINRVLKEMRGSGLITLSNGHLAVHDWPALIEAAGFDPGYLHLRQTDAN